MISLNIDHPLIEFQSKKQLLIGRQLSQSNEKKENVIDISYTFINDTPVIMQLIRNELEGYCQVKVVYIMLIAIHIMTTLISRQG